MKTKTGMRDERGAAAVEFALLLPLLTLILLGVLVFGLIFHIYLEMTHAAREGVRWAALRADFEEVKEHAMSAAPGIDWNMASFEATIDGGPIPAGGATDEDQRTPAEVIIKYNLADIRSIFGPLGSILPDSIRSSAVQRVE